MTAPPSIIQLIDHFHFGDQQVFPKVSTYTCLCFLSKTKQSEVIPILKMIATDGNLKRLSNGCFTIQNRSTERSRRSLKSKI